MLKPKDTWGLVFEVFEKMYVYKLFWIAPETKTIRWLRTSVLKHLKSKFPKADE